VSNNDNDNGIYKKNPSDNSIYKKDTSSISQVVDAEILKVRDKIKLVDEIKSNPPVKGEMETEIKDGIYSIDLDTLLNAQISDCPATVIPMLIDHGIRTAVDIKETYKPEKRAMDFHYVWVLILIAGIFGVIYLALSMIGII